MTPERLFLLCNSFAVVGWLILVFTGRTYWAARLVSGVIIPMMIATVYIYLIVAHFGEAQGGFGTLDQVAALFSNKWLLLAGWIHYLAFGPAGLLLYIVVRILRTRSLEIAAWRLNKSQI